MKRTAQDIMKEALATGKITPDDPNTLCPSYSELLDALHAALVCIADNPEFWAEEKMIRNIFKRVEPYTN